MGGIIGFSRTRTSTVLDDRGYVQLHVSVCDTLCSFVAVESTVDLDPNEAILHKDCVRYLFFLSPLLYG